MSEDYIHPVLNHEEIAREQEHVRKHLRWNLGCGFVDAVGWPLAWSLISSVTVLPYFISKLGGSNVLVGLISTVFAIGYSLPALFVSRLIEKRPVQVKAMFRIALVERVWLIPIIPATVAWGRSHPQWVLLTFFACIAAHAATLGCNYPAYATMIRKVIPANWRGRLYGIGGAVGGLLGVGGARLARYLLVHYGYPDGYAWCFGVCLLILFLSVIPLGLMREPAEIAIPPERSFGPYLRSAVETLRRHKDFSLFVLWLVLSVFHYVALAFYTVYAKQRFSVDAGQVASFTAAMMGANTLGYLVWGLLGDRRGLRKVLVGGQWCACVAVLMALLAPSAEAFYLVYALASLGSTAFEIASMNIVLEFAPRGLSALYAALSSTLVAPFRALLPLAGGLVADHLGFPPLFVVCGVCSTAGLVVLARVRDPRRRVLESVSA